MRVLIFHKAGDDIDMSGPPTPEQLAAFKAMDDFTEELVKAGIFVAAAGLKNTPEAKRIVFDGEGGKRTIDGPFAETKELIAGYTLIQVRDREEALEWARRFPAPFGEGVEGCIEVRPLYELDDFSAIEGIERFQALEAQHQGVQS